MWCGACAARTPRAASARRDRLEGLDDARRQPLSAWLAALSSALEDSGAMPVLQADAAGEQVIGGLRLGAAVPANGAWQAGATRIAMSLSEFGAWVDGALEQASFRPVAAFADAPDVVITPLADAMLRPFAAAVLAGADDRHLGAPATSIASLGEAQAAALGLPTAAEHLSFSARRAARVRGGTALRRRRARRFERSRATTRGATRPTTGGYGSTLPVARSGGCSTPSSSTRHSNSTPIARNCCATARRWVARSPASRCAARS